LTNTGWVIRFFNVRDYKDTYQFVGNYPQLGDRQEDEIIVFSGMYGIDDYILWYIHKNIELYDFSAVNIELELHLDRNTSMPFWRRIYKVMDVTYDPNEGKYVLYGISLETAILQTLLVEYEITSLNYKENRTAEEVLKEVLVDNGILKGVVYVEVPHEKELRNFEYRTLSFNREWSVYDFISYIADQNKFEWFVRDNVLYIGKEIKAFKHMNSTRKFDIETDNVADSVWFRKYVGMTRPMDVMSHIDGIWRCVWAKHSVGASGGISKGCFSRIGIGTLNKENYLRTLEGEYERTMASKLFSKDLSSSHYIMIGNVLKDEGEEKHVDMVSVQKNKDLYKINTPSEIKIDREDTSKYLLLYVKENVDRSTPYLDYKAGVLFPSLQLEDDKLPPNCIVFQPYGKEESPVIGPFVFGNSEDSFSIPKKDKDDFRFQLPDGFCIYKKKGGKFYLQLLDSDSESIPEEDEEKSYIVMDENGKIKINQSKECFLEIDSNKNITLQKDNNTIIKINQSGTIDVNTSGTVNIGANASAVNIAGGAKALAHAFHKHGFPHVHPVPNGPLITGPPGVTSQQTTLETQPCTDNTTKTKAD